MSRPSTYREAWEQGRAYLEGAGLDSREAAAQADWLLAAVCGCSRAGLRLRSGELLTERQAEKYAGFLKRRMSGEPVQYILETQFFMGHEFYVDSRVLIPRLDTEILCARALELLPEDSETAVLDVGAGSGALAVSIALQRPRARVTALDISEDALAVARLNAERLHARIRLVCSDFFAEIPEERFDLIISNPPYIAFGELAGLPADVRREPRLALDGGVDGLDAYRVLAREASSHLRPGGRLLVETGATQAEAVAGLFAAIGPVSVYEDLQGIRRFVCALCE